MTMTTEQNEQEYLTWCGERGLDPDEGRTARRFEEEKAGMSIEAWWDDMDADAAERMFWDDGPRRQ